VVEGIAGLIDACTTGSGRCATGLCGIRETGSFSRCSVPTGTTAKERSGAEVS
jgi:hypothetical protein